MKFERLALVGLLGLFATGCPGDKGDSGGIETGDTQVEIPALELTATLTDTGADLTIANAVENGFAEDGWLFGINQQGTEDNWTGEDCLDGYTAGSTTYQYCHESGVGGVTLTKADTSGDWASIVAQLDAGATLFPADAGTVSFYVQDPAGGCYVSGDTSGHYSALGCATF